LGAHHERPAAGTRLALHRSLRLAFHALLLAAFLCVAPPLGWSQEPIVCGTSEAAQADAAEAASLRAFARDLGLAATDAFVGTAESIHHSGHLPGCYLAKAAALARGWQPGGSLWQEAPGDAIGGDAYRNADGLLPAQYDGHYREADLDYRGGHRNARRLVYVEDSAGQWLQWVTVDHYRSFHKLPDAPP
jgi:ribonuclease T1